jgi:hypothetical protein
MFEAQGAITHVVPDRLSIEVVDGLADRVAKLSRSVLDRTRSLVENAFSS